MYAKYGKRVLDIVLSSLALIVLAIPMLLIALAVKLDDPGPALFRQKRLGLHGKTFEMLNVWREVYYMLPQRAA